MILCLRSTGSMDFSNSDNDRFFIFYNSQKIESRFSVFQSIHVIVYSAFSMTKQLFFLVFGDIQKKFRGLCRVRLSVVQVEMSR